MESQEPIDPPYVEMTQQLQDLTNSTSAEDYSTMKLTPTELVQIRQMLSNTTQEQQSTTQSEVPSEYTEFAETTHAWAVFADDPAKRATTLDRTVGTMIILFQLFTYWIFALEAVEDYQRGVVFVKTPHDNCVASDEEPQDNFTCEAEFTNNFDAFVAFFMLAIFLTSDLLQAARAIRIAPIGAPVLFACLAGIEVVCAFLSASVAVSYNLYIGEVTDAVEVGVGLLFIRELSSRAYAGIRYKNKKQYKSFFLVVAVLVGLGLGLDPVYERVFAPN